MVNVTIYKKGGVNPYSLYDSEDSRILEKFSQTWKLNSDDLIEMELSSAGVIDFSIGDYFTLYDRVYTLNVIPNVTKEGATRYKYSLKWEGSSYDLLRTQYFNVGEFITYEDLRDYENLYTTEFTQVGEADKFVDTICFNLQRIYGETVWVPGVCPITDYKTLTFNGENCLAVLQRICEEFDLEYEIVYNAGIYTINLYETGSLGTTLGVNFEYGYSKGLYTIDRKPLESEPFFTRLVVYGSTKNLPTNYRHYSKRLKLPGDEMSVLQDASKIALYGIIESTKIFEEVFPHRQSTVTGLGAKITQFIDTAMNFDLMAQDENGYIYLQPGVSPKVHFNSGSLAGYEFEISNYDHESFTFTIIPYTDERGLELPNTDDDTWRIGTSDEYTLLDINLGTTYIEEAEDELADLATTYYDRYSKPAVSYDVEVDSFFLGTTFAGLEQTNIIKPGDTCGLVDSSLGINENLRVVGLTRDLTYPMRYELELDYIKRKRVIKKIIDRTISTENDVKFAQMNNPTSRDLLSRIIRRNQNRIQTANNQMVFYDENGDSYFIIDATSPAAGGVGILGNNNANTEHSYIIILPSGIHIVDGDLGGDLTLNTERISLVQTAGAVFDVLGDYDGNLQVQISAGGLLTLLLTGIPKDPSGLQVGTLYNDGGIIKIVE